MVFQSEKWPPTGEVNTGFIAIRCNEASLLFWKEVSEHSVVGLEHGDQSIVNGLLSKKYTHPNLRTDVFPNRFWAPSQGTQIPNDIIMHHANTTVPIIENGLPIGSIELKIRKLNQIKNLVKTL